MKMIGDWLAAEGLAMPGPGEFFAAGFAFTLALLALLSGWIAGRRLGPRAGALWVRRVGGHVEGVAPRIGQIVRHGSAALLLALVYNADDWTSLARVGLGFALASATALLMVAILRGVSLPRWVAWSVAGTIFVAILSSALGGLHGLSEGLDAVGFAIGKRRFSLLALLTIVITVVVLFAAVRFANRIVSHSIHQSRGFDPAQKLLFEKLSTIAIIVAAFFVGIDLLDIDLTSLAVFSGAVGLAVGFGLQKTVGNLIAGIILLTDRSIKPGDVIVVGDSFGWVNKIGVRAVSVITREGKEHLIPNENLMTQEVENWSYSNRNVRLRIPVSVAYDCDLKLAQELMLRAATESPRVLDEPRPNVWLVEFGESAVKHEIRVWISDPEGGVSNLRSDVLNRLWWLFKEHGIVIPFPQRDVRIRQWSGTPVQGGDTEPS